MQINRLFEIVYLLMERDNVTATELAEHFEVTARTIYRDIDILSGAGIPVYSSRGRNGGIRLLENFTLDKSLLSSREQDEILFALQSLKKTRAADDGSLLARLSSLFHRERIDWIDVDFSEWDSGQQERDRFGILKNSILERRVLEFTYYNSNGETSRRSVEPFKLCFKMGSWYLQGFCRMRQDFRTFRISRMEDVHMTEQHFERREQPAPPIQSAPVESESVRLKLRLSPSAAYRVYDEFNPAQVVKQQDGSYLITVEYPETPWVYGYLLSFGENLKVLSPDRVRDILIEKAKKCIKNYGVP